MNIYVGNLSYKLNEEDLKKVFEQFGEITSVKIIKDKYSGRSKGFAFVEMADDAQAKDAIDKLNGNELEGRKMVVNEARPKSSN